MTDAVLWIAGDAAKATGGEINQDWSATGVSIDSRSIEQGDLFVALHGPNFDGHDFLEAAFDNGAAAAMVQRLPQGRLGEKPFLLVDDTLGALWRLGAAARLRANARIIAVTGSAGKTSTKEALRHCLDAQGKTAASRSSLNNHWGVPLSLSRMSPNVTYGVFELGMNNPGEILELTRLVRPHVAIITTVATAHIGNFNSVTEIADSKAEIFQAIEPEGAALLNREHPLFHYLRALAEDAGVTRVIGFGAHEDAEARLLACQRDGEGSTIEADIFGTRVQYRLPLPGWHMVANSLAALAAATLVGADTRETAASLESLPAVAGRGARRRIEGRNGAFMLIDDSYNANPASMRAAFDVLSHSAPEEGGRRIAVLGDMLELGPDADRLHGRLASGLTAVDLVYCCGPHMTALYNAIPESKRGAHTADSRTLAPLVAEDIRSGDVVLVKGSLGSRMAEAVDALMALQAPVPRAANGE